jgi:hypothetical protein
MSRGSSHVWTVKGGPLGGELELCLVLGWSVELMGEDSERE